MIMYNFIKIDILIIFIIITIIMGKRFVITEEERKEIKKQHGIAEDWWDDTVEFLKDTGEKIGDFVSDIFTDSDEEESKDAEDLKSTDFSSEEKKEIEKKLEDTKKELSSKITDSSLKGFNFDKIPDGKNNYRSAQITADLIPLVIKKYGIKRIIRFNGDDGDAKHAGKQGPSISEEKRICESNGCEFYKLSSTRNQDKVNSLLKQGNTLIHCAHGADRTGGNVGGYLYDIGWGDTKKIWDYTTKYNSWENMVINNPSKFTNGGYLNQAKKFGVKDIEQAKKLSK